MPAFVWPVRVYWEDTDAAGVVYYANYLRFMERARTEWLRAMGFEQTALLAEHGVQFVVRSAAIEYLAPARFNDSLDVSAELAAARASLMTVAQQVRRGESVLATASIGIVCVNTRSFRPARIPAAVLREFQREPA